MKKHKFILSDESVNSYGFKVLTDGIDTERFNANPVMLYEHSYRDLIGTWSDVKIEKGALTATPEFDEDDKLALKLQKKVEKGILKGCSIGLRILEWGEEVTKDGGILLVAIRSELREGSLTAVPSNANSLRLYDENGVQLSDNDIHVKLSALKEKEEDTPPIPTNSNSNSNMKLTAQNLTVLGLSSESSEDQVNAAVAKLASRNKELETQFETELSDRANALVNKAIEEKKLKAEQKDQYLSLAKTNYKMAEEILAGLSAPAESTDFIEKGGKSGGNAPEGRENWTFSDWRKKDAQGLLTLKAEDPETYNALLSADPSFGKMK
ncbi:MAG: hypothetical protein EP346_06960 [Bacteroidetes bacterium]|nr:MAG: hypothetical protein EP346_06960 [Bacteroidota bacterium]